MKYVIRVEDKYLSGSYIAFGDEHEVEFLGNKFSMKYFVPTLESIDHAVKFDDLETPTKMLSSLYWLPLDYIIEEYYGKFN